MSEETEQDTGAEASGAGVDPAAVALALGGASRQDAREFLKKQGALIDDQRHHLREQFKQLRLNIWQQRMGVLLRIATGFVGLAVAAGLTLMIWDAAHANGLIIESFSVPPDLAAKGLTGEVVATQMLDKLTDMQSNTKSNRAPRTYANNWSDDIKVEIPETGVSIGEAYTFLRGWLGNETHVSGEVFHNATGIAITARIGSDSGATFAGAESDLDALEQKAAEHLYGATQPYRYGVYLTGQNRKSEGIAVMQAATKTGSSSEQGWAYNGLGVENEEPGLGVPLRLFSRAVELDPANALATSNLANTERTLGHPERSLADYQKALALLSSKEQGEIRQDYIADFRQKQQNAIDAALGEFPSPDPRNARSAQQLATSAGASATEARHRAEGHDIGAARAILADPLPETPGNIEFGAITIGQTRILMAVMVQDWTDVLRQADLLQPLLQKHPRIHSQSHLTSDLNVALAEAKLGRFAAAEARVADTPGDCYPCLRMRAQIAEVKGDHAGADAWFARAVAAAPSIPFANSEWGAVLLERGQPDAAIEKFKLANKKGPHFADPLEGWGEALMKKNQSHLALAKFAEAEKYAPNWGRLHLKWGEALTYAGKKDEAQKQFALAAGLDLSADDKSELAKVKS